MSFVQSDSQFMHAKNQENQVCTCNGNTSHLVHFQNILFKCDIEPDLRSLFFRDMTSSLSVGTNHPLTAQN
jgi:hypothetical protein